MKPHVRRAPPRYHLAWRKAKLPHISHEIWFERLVTRVPKHAAKWGEKMPVRVEDLRTGELIHCNFDLRQAAYFATHKWPKRAAALRAIQKFYNPTPEDKAKAHQRKLLQLHERARRWSTKLKTAETKLRNTWAAIRRLEKHDPTRSPE